jgi:hypothetical protein
MSNKSKDVDILASLSGGVVDNTQIPSYTTSETPAFQAAQNKGSKETPLSAEAVKLQQEILELELQAKKLEILERTANLEDVQERIADRKVTRETRMQRSRTNGQTLRQIDNENAQMQKRCNHKKGGNGSAGVVGGKGDDNQYAVLKHTFANGDTWVRCLRCGKCWKPLPSPVEPLEEDFDSPQDYANATKEYTKLLGVFNKLNNEYLTALEFTTRNIASSSVLFRWSDNGEYYRKVTEQTNLR